MLFDALWRPVVFCCAGIFAATANRYDATSSRAVGQSGPQFGFRDKDRSAVSLQALPRFARKNRSIDRSLDRRLAADGELLMASSAA
jgi:hypothetical protein